MTYPPPGGQGPGGPGYGPPPGGGYGPPPQGSWGQPGAAPQRTGGVNLSALTPVDWIAPGAAVLALIFSFLKFYTADLSASLGGESRSQSAHENAWHGFFGWFAVVLAIAAALILIAQLAPTKLPFPPRVAALGVWTLAVISIVIAIFVTPGAKSEADTKSALGVPDNVNFSLDYGRGIGFWLTLVFIVIGAAATGYGYATAQKASASPGSGFGGPGNGGPPPGFGQTPGQPGGFGPAQNRPPQGPPPGGYGPPPQGPPPQGYGQPPQGPPPGGYGPPPQGPPTQGPPPQGYGR